MKKWRLNNMKQSALAKKYLTEPYWQNNLNSPDEAVAKAKAARGLRITHKEARNFYASEQGQPSSLLYTIFANAGLPVPEAFKEEWNAAAAKHNLARQLASGLEGLPI